MAVIPDTHNTGLTPTQIDTAFSNALTHTPSDSTPKEDGSGSAGEAETFARSDHEHPHDTTKQDTLTFEGTYSASTNKVTTMSAVKDGKLTGYAQSSGNVAATDKVIEAIGKVEKKADDNKTNILSNWTTGKNIIKTVNPIVSNPTLASNFTITLNADNTFTVSGSATETVLIGFDVTLPTGTYTISGCPSGGGTTNYQVDLRDNSWSGVSNADTGNGVQFTNNTAGTYKYTVRIAANYVCNNLLIKPMISTSSDTTYQPYAMSNVELTENKIGASDYATQNTGGTVRAWTTTDGTSTTLHIATEAPTP